MRVEVGMPVYHPSKRLKTVLTALANQTYNDFFITIYNNTELENSEEIRIDEQIVDEMRRKYNLDIAIVQNEYNMGYMKNMRQIMEKASGDVLILLADDDIISRDCVQLVVDAFNEAKVGVVARPYYWFTNDMKRAVRFEGSICEKTKNIDILGDDTRSIINCLTSSGQLSGLAFRTSCLQGMPFEEDMFTAHVYPFLYVFSKYQCAYLPQPTVAVSISTSQCHSDIYDPSPIGQWMKLFNTILRDGVYDDIRTKLKEKYLTDYFGFAQIKNYGTWKELLREIGLFVSFYPRNLLRIQFYIFIIGCILCPRCVLRKMTDWYKENIISKQLEKINIDYSRFPFEEVELLWNK